MKIGKYNFKNEEQALQKIVDLGVGIDFEGNEYPTHNHLVVKLGHIILENGEYELNENAEMQIIKEPLFSDKFHIDVLWHDLENHPYGWKTYSVDLDNEGCHEFMGLSYLEHKI